MFIYIIIIVIHYELWVSDLFLFFFIMKFGMVTLKASD